MFGHVGPRFKWKSCAWDISTCRAITSKFSRHLAINIFKSGWDSPSKKSLQLPDGRTPLLDVAGTNRTETRPQDVGVGRVAAANQGYKYSATAMLWETLMEWAQIPIMSFQDKTWSILEGPMLGHVLFVL